jgi:hypothetical protein
MKRINIAVLMVIILMFSAACGNTETSSENNTEVVTKEEVTTETANVASPTDLFKDIDMDDLALSIVQESCEARWDVQIETEDDFTYINNNNVYLNGRYYGEFHWLKELLTKYNETEYNNICKYTSDNFKDRQFKDENLQKYMIAYAEAVEQQLEICKHTDFSDPDESDKYVEYADAKCLAILDIMNEYDLQFDNKYISNVQELKDTPATSTDSE